jgi:cytochrome b subunit of formate dehydrogenase
VAARREGRRSRPWSERSRAEKYAFIQSQVLFWVLYLVAMYLVATHIGVWFAVFAFGGSIVLTAVATVLGVRRRRR